MNPATYVPIIIIFLVLFLMFREQKRMVIKKLIKKRRSEERVRMTEIAKKFIDKECIIYTFNSQLSGTVKEVTDGALLVENGGTLEAVNIDFVVRIREYPKKKNGKKKSVVLD